MGEKLQKSLLWAVVLSESSHVFCCVFPTLFSLMGLLASFGLVVAMPGYVVELHDLMHAWEVPMILFSGIILVLGWIVVHYSEKMDCHDTGCGHGACGKSKKRAHLVLKVATVVFVANVLIYTFIHRAEWFNEQSPLMHSVSDLHHEDHNHP